LILVTSGVVQGFLRTSRVGARGGLCVPPRTQHAQQMKCFAANDNIFETLFDLSKNPNTVPVTVSVVLTLILYGEQKKLGEGLKEVREDMKEMRKDMKEEFVMIRKDMKEEFGTLRKDMKEEFGTLRKDMREDSRAIARRFDTAVLLAFVSVMVTAVAALRPSLAGGLFPGL
jgi:hypothetical protein